MKHILLYKYFLVGDFMETINYGSTGPTVDLLQSVLLKLGYYSGNVDGIFGNNTKLAVENFQADFRLDATRRSKFRYMG